MPMATCILLSEERSAVITRRSFRMHPIEFVARRGRRWSRLLPALVAAAGLGTVGARDAAAGTLLVSSTGVTGKVLRYHAQTGAADGVLILPGEGGMSSIPQHLMYGRDGFVYVSDYN